MKHLTLAVFGLFVLATAALAQDNNQGGARPGGRGGFGGAGGMMMGRGTFGGDGLRETVSALGELNLSPDFTLTGEQKQKIAAIRDDYKKQTDKWRTDHEADLKKLREQGAALRGGGDGAREKFQELMKANQDLQATAPKADEFIKQIKAVLNGDQAKAFEAKQAELEKSRQEMRERMQQNFGGGQGGQGGQGGRQRGGQRGGQGGGGNL